MNNTAQRQDLLRCLKEMERWELLNPSGGAASVRLDDGTILISTTGLASQGWRISLRDFIQLAPDDGRIIEQTSGLGASGTPLHLALYRALPTAGAIIHAHAPYSLVFASLGLPVPAVTARCDLIGDVPCLAADDGRIKAEYRRSPHPVELPEGMVQRPEVALINIDHYQPQVTKLAAELGDSFAFRGLACTLYRHGLLVAARDLDQARDLAMRVEESARTALYQAQLAPGVSHIRTNALYPATA